MAGVLLPTVFRSGLNLVLVGIVLIGGAVGALCYFGHNLWTALDGPTEVTLEDIAKLDDPRQLPSTWVKVKFDKAVKSAVVVESKPTNGGLSHVTEEFLMFQAGERWMIAGVPRGFDGQELSGHVWRRSDKLSRDAAATVTEELKAVHQGNVFPFEFDASEDYGTYWKAMSGVMLFFAAAGGLFGSFGLSVIGKSYRPPDPREFGLDPDDYADLIIETRADAEAAAVLFVRDAGLESDGSIVADPNSLRRRTVG
jgi:hypothetical protein